MVHLTTLKECMQQIAAKAAERITLTSEMSYSDEYTHMNTCTKSLDHCVCLCVGSGSVYEIVECRLQLEHWGQLKLSN